VVVLPTPPFWFTMEMIFATGHLLSGPQPCLMHGISAVEHCGVMTQ